jgi:OOP family OmpA-OmpF porin
MKRIALSALVAATLASASSFDYEVTPVAGYLWNKEYNDKTGAMGGISKDDSIQNHTVFGLEAQFNNLSFWGFTPEVSLLYGEDKILNAAEESKIWTGMVNAVYDFNQDSTIRPFVKVGLGYEAERPALENDYNGFLANVGAGLKLDLTKSIALKLEALTFLKNNDGDTGTSKGAIWNCVGLAGLTFKLGEVKPAVVAAPVAVVAASEPTPAPVAVVAPVVVVPMDSDKDGVIDANDKCANSPAGYAVNASGCNIDSDKDGVLDPADKCANTPAGTKVDAAGCTVDGDGDKDGVKDSMDKCPTTPAGTKVDAAGCTVDGDGDKDGIKDSMDKCPTTPAGYKVDGDGCVVKSELRLNFAVGSAVIKAADQKQVDDFVTYMKENPDQKVTVVGYTSSIGKAPYNKKLSENRAKAFKNAAVKGGVDAKRIATAGKGEANPIADNKTVEGRNANQRIELEFSKAKK